MSAVYLISHSADRLNAVSRRPQLLPERPDVNVHRAALSVELVSLDLIQELSPGEHVPLVADEDAEHFKLL